MAKGRTVPAVIMLIHDALLLFLIKKELATVKC